MGLSFSGFCASCRRAVALSEIRKSDKLHPEFLEFFFQKFGFWPLGCMGLPALPASRPQRISGRKFEKIGLASLTQAKRLAGMPTSHQ
jgi:hypothetical protein